MGNWSEEDLIKASKGGDFGIMPLPISTNAKAYGNTSISVGVPGYFMIDNQQSTKEQRDGAIDFLTWLYTSKAGQQAVIGSAASGGMNFIPVYSGTTVKATSFMAREIASYVKANKTIEWINTYYPAGGQELYGASGQKLITDKIDGEQYAAEIEKAWKGAVKTWRGVKK
jgi:raffinose/stachyose/melibiose transport system substrate-binding protein